LNTTDDNDLVRNDLNDSIVLVDSSNNTIVSNFISNGGGLGAAIAVGVFGGGNNNEIHANTTNNNNSNGLQLFAGSGNNVTGNTSLNNLGDDMEDDNPNCDSNKWEGNKFSRASTRLTALANAMHPEVSDLQDRAAPKKPPSCAAFLFCLKVLVAELRGIAPQRASHLVRPIAIRSGWCSHLFGSFPRNSGFRARVFSPYFRAPREIVGCFPSISAYLMLCCVPSSRLEGVAARLLNNELLEK
jgi:hypothetical protein